MRHLYEIENYSQGTYLEDVFTDYDLAVRVAERATRETGYTHIVKEIY